MMRGKKVLAGVLAVGLSLSLAVPVLAKPVLAEPVPAKPALAEEEPTDKPTDKILETLKAVGEHIKEKGTPVYEGVSLFLDSMKDENGKIDWAKVGETINELGGAVTGDSFDDVDAYIAEYEKIHKAIDAYILDMNKDSLPGDVPIISKVIAYNDYDVLQDEIKVLGEFTEMNFTEEDGQLAFTSSSSIPILFTLNHKDGGLEVTDAKQAEDGEGNAAAIKGFCDEVGITKDEYDDAMEFREYHDLVALADYMNEHPEIKSIEYAGEFCSLEDLEKMSDAILDEQFPAEQN